MLVRHLLESLDEEAYEPVLLIPMPGVSDGRWILDRFARQLGVEEPAEELSTLLGQLYEQLAMVREDGRRAVLIIDEAQVLADQGLLERAARSAEPRVRGSPSAHGGPGGAAPSRQGDGRERGAGGAGRDPRGDSIPGSGRLRPLPESPDPRRRWRSGDSRVGRDRRHREPGLAEIRVGSISWRTTRCSRPIWPAGSARPCRTWRVRPRISVSRWKRRIPNRGATRMLPSSTKRPARRAADLAERDQRGDRGGHQSSGPGGAIQPRPSPSSPIRGRPRTKRSTTSS